MMEDQKWNPQNTITVDIADAISGGVKHLSPRYQAAWLVCHVGQILNVICAVICVFATFIGIAEAPRFMPLFISGAIAAIPLHVFFSIGKMVADIASSVDAKTQA